MAKDQTTAQAETETKAPFVIDETWAVSAQGIAVTVKPVASANGMTNANVVFDEVVMNVTKFVKDEGEKTINAFEVEMNGDKFAARSQHIAINDAVNALNDSDQPIAKVTSKNPTGYDFEVTNKGTKTSNTPEFTAEQTETLDNAANDAKAAYDSIIEAERVGRDGAFKLGAAIKTVQDLFIQVQGNAGKKAWGEFLSAKMGIDAAKCKNLASEHRILAEFPASYWEAAPEGANSAKTLNAYHAETRKELCAAIMADVSFTTKDAKTLLAQAKGASVDKVKQVAGDLLDEGKTKEKVAASFAAICSDDEGEKAYHILAPLVTLDHLKERANYLRAAMIDLINAEVNELSEEEEEKQEAVKAAETVSRGFHNFTQQEAADHLWNILVSREDKEDMGDILDMLDTKLAAYEPASEEENDADQEEG